MCPFDPPLELSLSEYRAMFLRHDRWPISVLNLAKLSPLSDSHPVRVIRGWDLSTGRFRQGCFR